MNTWLFGFIYDTPSNFINTIKVKKRGSMHFSLYTENWRWCRIETLKLKIKVSIYFMERITKNSIFCKLFMDVVVYILHDTQ